MAGGRILRNVSASARNAAKAAEEAKRIADAKKRKPIRTGEQTEVLLPESRPSRDKEKQTYEEREINASGRISAMLTKAGPKPLSMAVYRSLPTSDRNAFARQAKKDFNNGIITKKQYETIIERIEAAELDKNVRAMEQGKANKKAKPPTTPTAPFDIPSSAKGVKGLNMNKGGMARKKSAKGGYANCGASMKPTQKSSQGIA